MSVDVMSESDIIRTIGLMYGSGSDIWQKIEAGTATSAEIYQAYSVIPQMKLQSSLDGSQVLGWDYDYPNYPVVFDDTASGINSNFDFSSYSGQTFNALVPSNAGGGSGNPYTFKSGGVFTGTSNPASILNSPVSPTLAVSGVSLACKLGATISEALYDLNPNWWAENLPTMNPETWGQIAGSNETGQAMLRTLFGINSNGSMSAYMSSESLAYVYQFLRDNGAFGSGDSVATVQTYTPQSAEWELSSNCDYLQMPLKIYQMSEFEKPIAGSTDVYKFKIINNTATVYELFFFNTIDNKWYSYPSFVSSAPFTYTRQRYTSTGNPVGNLFTTNVNSATVFNNTNYYVSRNSGIGGTDDTNNYSPNNINHTYGNSYFPTVLDLIKLVFNQELVFPSGIDGIGTQPNATVPDPSVITGTTTSEVLQQLKQNYPQLFDGSVTNTVMQNDGTLKDYEYVPVPWMDNTTQTSPQPTTGTRTQTDTNVSPQTAPELFPTSTGESTNPPDTGTGDGSADPIPTGSASSLWAIYNPTQSQLDSFGSWLWSSNFVEQLKKLFNDPMQAIIGVHKVYATPPTSGAENIKCGYLDSGVSAAKVSSQYTTIDCGTVNLNEYFGNVFDYDPYTKISAYLPFIGVVPLKTSEVMRGKINITYGVDVITGACLAKIHVTRDGFGGIIYSFGGSCACHYPISSGSYSGIVSGVITAATGIAAGVATGNPLAAVGGVVAGAKSMHANVQHSGGFTGCAGVMGPKIPYIIIERPQIKMANGYEGFEGMPANDVVSIGSCSGYVKFKEVHAEIAGAYDEELTEIETLLKSGILV